MTHVQSMNSFGPLGIGPVALIREYSKPVQSWRNEFAPSAQAIHRSDWWEDYVRGYGRESDDQAWSNWCYKKMIIGPPRYRTDREIAITGLDDEYLSDDDIERHYLQWVDTWPPRGDIRWCSVRGIPEWAIKEFLYKQ